MRRDGHIDVRVSRRAFAAGTVASGALALTAVAGGAMTLVACDPAREKPAVYPGGEGNAETTALEREMFERVNADRAARGLPALSYDAALADIARNHAADMRQHKFFAHESPNTGPLDQRLVRWGYLAKVARENLAEASTVQAAEDGLLKSPHHFENLMAKDITHIGVGIVRGGVADARNLLAVQVFARPIVVVSNDALVDRVLAKIAAGRAGKRPLERDALLDDLASAYVDALPATMDEADLQRGLKQAVAALPKGTKYRGLVGYANLVYEAEDVEMTGAAFDANTVAVGIAAADAKDQRGMACHKLVALFAI